MDVDSTHQDQDHPKKLESTNEEFVVVSITSSFHVITSGSRITRFHWYFVHFKVHFRSTFWSIFQGTFWSTFQGTFGVHFKVHFRVFHYWISLFCFPPDKNICEQKVSKLQCTVMAGIVLRPSGVLFIKTCFCRSRKSASQQNLLCPQFVRWNNDETEVKNISRAEIY